MIRKTLIVKNQLGIHARAAGSLVRLSRKFSARIRLEKDGIFANAESILELLFLNATVGSRVMVTVTGHDEEEALAAVENLLEKQCYEYSVLAPRTLELAPGRSAAL